MSDIKTKFTLHNEYKDFVSGVTNIKFETLMPFNRATNLPTLGCLEWTLLLGMLLTVMMIREISHQAIEPFLFQHFSEEITAQVTACHMEKTSSFGYVPHLTYTYTWNGQERQASKNIYGYGLGQCPQYLDQPLPIYVLVPDPNQTRPLLADSSRPWTDSAFWTAIYMFTAATGLYLMYFFLHNVALYLLGRQRYPRLVKRGTLLEGKIIAIGASVHEKSKAYVVVVDYAFETPRKRHLTGKAEAHRQDLKDAVLPPVGTPVTILYADDKAYMML